MYINKRKWTRCGCNEKTFPVFETAWRFAAKQIPAWGRSKNPSSLWSRR